jgi:hypothetical protein
MIKTNHNTDGKHKNKQSIYSITMVTFRKIHNRKAQNPLTANDHQPIKLPPLYYTGIKNSYTNIVILHTTLI